MQTMAPPEDAMKERFARIDERSDRTDERILEVDRRVAEAAKETGRRIDENTVEIKGLRQEMIALNTTVQRGNYAVFAAIIGAILAILAKGG